MRRFIKRRDANHDAIVRVLKRIPGAVVVDTHLVGGFVDVVLLHRGRVHLIEIKDGSKPANRKRLTPMEAAFHAAAAGAGVKVEIVESGDAALAVLDGE